MNRQSQRTVSLGRRTVACLLALVMVLGLVPAALPQAAAVSVNDAMQKVVDWGFMRGDINGNLRPNDPITRAEFVTIVNRAFGYHVMGKAPFTDVKDADWYAQDVSIAYTENYITGTTATTFSPKGKLTREQAVVILARNMRLQAYPGEDTSFSDSRDLQEWSRGLVEQAVRYHLVSGYPDGTFRPKRAITRGEAAVLLVNAVGNPVQEKGVHTLDGVYGNVTITASGVTLRDTVVAGNLYITDGVDLGSILLENVRVLGQIVVCGGGVSENGDDSIVLRNVDAQELIVDTQRGQEISLRVEGDGTIQKATVRTNGFVKDNTGDSVGIREIVLDGGKGAKLSLAGNLKKVVNKTPGSTLNLVSGTAASITIDEAATGSTLNLEAGTLADEVNLDVGTTVTGKGDIGKLTVNAPGSTVTMLPDQIIIRPGLNATINGTVMDSNAAAEASADPRLMGGYPSVTDLAPTSAQVKFRGNKAGTVYWAVTPITAGSVGAGDLINPPSYSTEILKHGTASLSGSAAENTTKLTGLTAGGSYYLSAVFVDARETQSPVKVISFSTPDNTVPNFASGYPYLSRVTNISAQVTVMTTKTCQLYYALLPKGSTAPKPEDFKSGAIPGNLGYGTRAMTKNSPDSFDVNDKPLHELETYDLYLWLTDREGGVSSSVKKLTFTTVDKTPPVFNTEPTINKVEEKSVGLYANLNEAGTLFWVVVAQGEEYPKPLAGQSGAVDLSSENAKIQVAAGMNALKSGKVSMAEGKDVSFNVSGLDPEKAYDLYYVAQDKAGNYSETVKKLTIHTKDPNAPTVTQEFTKYNGTDTTTPLPNTDIRLVFSEEVQTVDTNTPLVQLYQDVVKVGGDKVAEAAARDTMGNVLRNSIKLYASTGNGLPEVVPDGGLVSSKEDDKWIIDYRYAEITLEEGKTVVTFRTRDNVEESALCLESGLEYNFEIQADTLADTSSTKNVMGRVPLDPFKTVFAIVNLSNPNITSLDGSADVDKRVDVSWTLSPMTTENTADNVDWDMVIWSDTSVVFKLYRRANEAGQTGNWEALGERTVTVPDTVGRVGVSLTRHFLQDTNAPDFAPLNDLKEDTKYEYAIHFTQVGSLTDPNTWSQRINIGINILAGSTNDLQTLSNDLTVEHYEQMVPSQLTNIGQPNNFNLIKQFSDQTPPSFASATPDFAAGSSAVNMNLALDRPGTLYYVVAPKGTIPTIGIENDVPDKQLNFAGDDYSTLPDKGQYESDGTTFKYPQTIQSPARLDIVNASKTYAGNARIKYGSTGLGTYLRDVLVEGLEPEKDYIAYFVVQGMSNQTYSPVYAYRFETSDVDIPYITMEAENPEVSFRTSENAKLNYVLFAYNQLPGVFNGEMKGENLANPDDGPIISITDPGENKDNVMTVLEAMLQTKDKQTGKSYFDVHASQDLKNTVQEIIQRQQTGGGGSPATNGTINTTKNEVKRVDFKSAMQNNSGSNATYFYCLATAQNALGSAYSFKAVEDVHIKDLDPPYLINISNTLIETGTNTDKYSGTLILTFNEPIYYMKRLENSSSGDPKTLRPVVSHPYGDVLPTDKNPGYISIMKAASMTGGKFESTRYDTDPTLSFTIQCTEISPGATIVLSNKGVISDASQNGVLEPFILRLEVTKIGVGGGFAKKITFVVDRGEYHPSNGKPE